MSETKNIVFDEQGRMIAFVSDQVIRACQKLGLTVELDVDVNLLLDFIKLAPEWKLICKDAQIWTIGG